MSDWHTKKKIIKRGGQGMKVKALLRRMENARQGK